MVIAMMLAIIYFATMIRETAIVLMHVLIFWYFLYRLAMVNAIMSVIFQAVIGMVEIVVAIMIVL